MRSLSRLLLVALLSVVVTGGLASGLAAWRAGHLEAGELFDAKLAHSARVLRALVDGALDDTAPPPGAPPLEIPVWEGIAEGEGTDLATATGHAYETKLAFQVWSDDGRLLLRSDNAPLAPLAGLQPGFGERTVDGVHWRSFVLASSARRWYLAGEREDVRADIAGDIARGILMPLLLELPLLAVAIWLVIGIGRRALGRVTAQVQARAADHLSPLDLGRVPEEVAGLVEAVNGLLAELEAALQRERRFTADAAHELRTPLAALRVHLDNLRASPDVAERSATEAQLERGLSRLDRLVAQLLTLSRLEPGAPLPARQPVDLAEVVRDTVAEHIEAEPGEAGRVDLEVRPGVLVCGDRALLGTLVRNLLDNALRYAPGEATVRVAVLPGQSSARLVVEDGGPGIPEPDRAAVLERFRRRLGTGVEGSGLGLSIAERVVEIHGGGLHLDRSPALGGLRVTVDFPGCS